MTKDSFYVETEALRVADTLTRKALHQLLDNRLPVKFAQLDDDGLWKTKKLIDSVLLKFTNQKFKHFKFQQKLDFHTRANLILISHLIWTRSTEDYDKGKCGKVGYRDYINDRVCTWTRSQTCLLLIDKKKQEVVYFKYSQWDRGNIWMPHESRVTLNFKHCAEPLLKKLAKK